VDVGANHPTEHNLTWLLELQGWTGILVEPNPRLCELLRAQRPRSRTFQVAVGRPEQVGEADLHIALGEGQSALKPDLGAELTGEVIRTKVRTLDSILEESGLGRIHFLSLDVEGMELDVLQGFSLPKHQPDLILIEDHFYNYKKHSYLRRHGYKLVRRTGYNNWYVPQSAPANVFSASSNRELFHLVRKMWLSWPFIKAKRALKRLRLKLRPLGRPPCAEF
jgi:FkbM family methyltransferase